MATIKSEKPQSNGLLGEIGILILGLLFLGYMAYLRILPAFVAFWAAHGWQVEAVAAVMAIASSVMAAALLWNRYGDLLYERGIWAPGKNAITLGKDEDGRVVALQQEFLKSHLQVIGNTGSGKTESVILPLAIETAEAGCGLLIIDGKSEQSFLDKLHSYVDKAGRTRDFRYFSLADVEKSSTFNPFVGGEPDEVAERIFSAFEFENEHYRNVQRQVFLAIVRLICSRDRIPTFSLVHRLLTDAVALKGWNENCPGPRPSSS